MSVVGVALHAQQNRIVEFPQAPFLFGDQVMHVVARALVTVAALEERQSTRPLFLGFGKIRTGHWIPQT